ncbi:macro domain-containing protein [Microbulbifer sp. JTAC008]|uniref:macro domain-containing protein n=1 Tax=unclassified Microbulbifer TaxID=2619833 RepID=UPI004039E127
MVSPANSFGIRDGGLDLPIMGRLGFQVEDRVQARIKSDFHVELPIGSAVLVATSHENWPYLISAPTTRVPEDVSNTLNAYYVFRAILNSVQLFNRSNSPERINSILCPGLGTGIGNLSARRCTGHM